MSEMKYWVSELELRNYCGYRQATFDFTDGQNINPINVLYGPNGDGKSKALAALEMLGNSQAFQGRDNDLLFRKMTFHPDYDPTLPHFTKHKLDMMMRAIFVDENDLPHQAELVSINSKKENFSGARVMEIPGRDVTVKIDADHIMNMNKFQIPADRIEQFIDMAEIVYGYKCQVGSNVTTNLGGASSVQSGKPQKAVKFYQDFILDKGDSKVHFKSMSDGEKKIATLLRNLCNPTVIDRPGIVLIDNVEMHIYFKRHARMIDKLLTEFPHKQFIVTTHSQVIIDHVGKTYGSKCLFEIPIIKGQAMIEA